MKLTKMKLKQIIKEEMQNIIVSERDMEEPAAAAAAPEEEAAPERERDVQIVLTHIPKINLPKEYKQLVDAIISHGVDGDIPGANRILRNLRAELNKIVPNMQ